MEMCRKFNKKKLLKHVTKYFFKQQIINYAIKQVDLNYNMCKKKRKEKKIIDFVTL